jgi:hypothetical protein
VIVATPDVIPPIVDRDTFARAGAALSRAQRNMNPGGKAASYLFTHMLVRGDCGSYLRGQTVKGEKSYVCSRCKDYGSAACSRNMVWERTVKEAMIAALLDDILSLERLDQIEAEMERRLEKERASGEADRLRCQIETLERGIAQGNAKLARLPEDRLGGVIA